MPTRNNTGRLGPAATFFKGLAWGRGAAWVAGCVLIATLWCVLTGWKQCGDVSWGVAYLIVFGVFLWPVITCFGSIVFLAGLLSGRCDPKSLNRAGWIVFALLACGCVAGGIMATPLPQPCRFDV